MQSIGRQKCGCGRLHAVLVTKRPPLRLDPDSDELLLLVPTSKGLAELPLRFCPFCGTKLDDENEPFVRMVSPDEEEVAQADILRTTLASRGDAIQRFGEPTAAIKASGNDPSADALVEVLIWENAFKSIRLYVEILRSRKLRVHWRGRIQSPKGFDKLRDG